MATHDYVIANQSGAAFRTDLNNALSAIVSNNSNSSEPATKYAYQWWADTNTSKMKIRNSSNDGWIDLFTLAGGIAVDAASAFNEDVTFTGASANIVFDKSDSALEFADNAKAKFGTGGDLEVFHNGSHSVIADVGTGNLQLRCADFRVTNADNSETLITGNTNGAIELYFDNSKKLETASDKINFHAHAKVNANATFDLGASGARWNDLYIANDIKVSDDGQILLGNSDDFKFFHTSGGVNTIIAANGELMFQCNTFNFRNENGSENFIHATENGAVTLYYDNEAKFQTDDDGPKSIGRHQFANDSGTTGGFTHCLVSGTISDGGTFTAQTFNTHAGGLVTITTNRRPSGSNNKNISIFPIVLNSTSTASLGTALSAMAGSSGSSFSVAGTSKGVIVTNTSGLDQRITVRFDITG